MKLKIKSYNGEIPDYLTLGKLYNIEEALDENLFSIYDDNGDNMIVFVENCGFLNDGSWEIVDEA